MVYDEHLDALVVEEYDDCAHNHADTRDILQNQYINIERTGGLISTPSSAHLILNVYEETLLFMANDFETDSEQIKKAMLRASDRLEEWVYHNL